MRVETLEQAARECGGLILQVRAKGLSAEDKADAPQGSHFVTEADTQSQALGIEIIHREFPDEVMVAEEQEHTAGIPADCTVFDPVDGTTLFYNGGREFGVTLCTLRDGKPVQGVMYFPTDNLMFRCERGTGVWMNNTQLPSLKWDRPLDKTMLGTDLGPWTVQSVIQGINADKFVVRSILVGIYGARAMLLRETGAYWSLNAGSIWDIAAGSLMIEELGGLALDPWGKPLTWDHLAADVVWAANQELAEVVLKHTRQWRGRKTV